MFIPYKVRLAGTPSSEALATKAATKVTSCQRIFSICLLRLPRGL
jgi:hypothetical protein